MAVQRTEDALEVKSRSNTAVALQHFLVPPPTAEMVWAPTRSGKELRVGALAHCMQLIGRIGQAAEAAERR